MTNRRARAGLAWLALGIALALGVGGCAAQGQDSPEATSAGEKAGARTVAVTMGEKTEERYFFDPSRIEVGTGEVVTFSLHNVGKLEHEFEGEEVSLEEVVVPPGKERTVTWRAPAKPGRYEIVCDLPGHRERGMVLEVVVK